MTPAAAAHVVPGLELARQVVAQRVPDQILDPAGLADRSNSDHQNLHLIQRPQRLSLGGDALTAIGREDRLGIRGVEHLGRKH